MKLAILGSTRGTNMEAIVSAIHDGRLNASIEIVISNKENAGILERARKHGIPAEFLSDEKKISESLKKSAVDLIVLIGYMRILSDSFVHEWRNKIINVHPSLLPDFAGGMDLKVHQAVLDAGVKETGCTVHYVTTEVDAGPIMIQKKCAVLLGDTAETLKSRVQALEGEALVEAIEKIT